MCPVRMPRIQRSSDGNTRYRATPRHGKEQRAGQLLTQETAETDNSAISPARMTAAATEAATATAAALAEAGVATATGAAADETAAGATEAAGAATATATGCRSQQGHGTQDDTGPAREGT